jgi:tyrosyl-tRNA synthetase
MASLGIPERIDLIKENLAEVLNFEIIEGILAEGRNPRIYWGMHFTMLFSPHASQ